MAEVTQTQPRVKEYQDYAKSQIDEQAILDKYNAATIAQFNVQREQNRQAENQFYNQMYNTQKTAMDTIRQANAAAVSSGASRGVQAANELSALLGLEQESVASATELAQANRQTAQEETAAVLENVLNAYQQAAQERSQLVTQGIEAASLSAQESQAQTDRAKLFAEAAENGTLTYLNALSQSGVDYSNGVVTPDSSVSFDTALSNIGKTKEGNSLLFEGNDWGGQSHAGNKATTITNSINAICDAYGLDKTTYAQELKDLQDIASNADVDWTGAAPSDTIQKKMSKYGVNYTGSFLWGKSNYANAVNGVYDHLLTRVRNDYLNGNNRIQKQ